MNAQIKRHMNFLHPKQVREIAKRFKTPCFVYDEAMLVRAAENALSFPNNNGLTVRFSMKALPNASVLRLFDRLGLHIDASSGFEARRALKIGISPDRIQLTAQETPGDLESLISKGVRFVACSLHQAERFGRAFPGGSLGIRINPGLGSGHSSKTNVGGPSSSFGIWKEHIPAILECARRFGLEIRILHTHIGSGADPEVWKKVARMTLDTVECFPTVKTVNLGGGYKVGRMPGEKSTDLHACGRAILSAFESFENRTGRKLSLEIEPGTYLTARAGSLVATITDIVDTGTDGYMFYKVDTGMTEIARFTLYGSLHPLVVVPRDESRETRPQDPVSVIVAGHCCESGDILTPRKGKPEEPAPRKLPRADIGDYLVIEAAGAYCAGMSTKNYNSFPEAPEVLLCRDGSFRLVRRRQTVEQMLANEIFDRPGVEIGTAGA
jgi:diaminopimelate decarboxylase